MYQNLPVLLVSILASIILSVSLVFLRMCILNCRAQRKTPIPRATESLPQSFTQNNQMRSTSAFEPSDHQIIFARMPPRLPQLNAVRSNAGTPATQIVQQIEEQFHMDNLQIEFERRAQERRDVLNISNSHHMPPTLQDIDSDISNERRTEIYPNVSPIDIVENNFSYANPAPRYVSQDAELPSYEEAIATNNGNGTNVQK